MAINNEYIPIDNQPTIKPRTVTGIITKHIAKTIPLAFDESMSYYECLCALLEYINTRVIPALDNNAAGLLELQEFYEELQTHVNNAIEEFETNVDNTVQSLEDFMNNYFDNLDVQEEINNKLDEMLDDGTIATILQNFLNLERIYDTATDMISDTTIVNGSRCRTLGYKSINDGGAAIYKISDTASDFSISVSNSLYANLIIEDGININALGADNTGVEDSSVLINSILNKINDLWLNNDNIINTIILDGKYLFNSQIVLPPCARLRGNGFVEITTNVDNNSAIHITYLSQQRPADFIGNKADWNYSELLNFDKGCVIKNISENNATCIEIGTTTDYGENYPIARYKLCNFRIQNYNIGILHNIYHVYIGKYENISFETNTIGVQYGKTAGQTVVDSGENMNYHNCLFSTGTHAVVLNTDGFDSVFDQCSFDFLTNVFTNNYTSGYQRLVCYGCHFEGMKQYMLNGFGPYSIFSITNSAIIDNYTAGVRCKYFNNCDNTSTYILENNKLVGTTATSYDPEKLYQSAPNIKFSNSYIPSNLWTGFLKDNDLLYGLFDNIEDGTYTVVSGTPSSSLNNLRFEFNSGLISDQFEIRTDNYLYTGHKSLIIKSNSTATSNKAITCLTDYIDVSNINKLYINTITKNIKRGTNLTVKSYDVNKVQIGNDESVYHNASPQPNELGNTWYSSAYCGRFIKKPNCSLIKLQVSVGNLNGGSSDPIGTEYIIGGIVINKQ